MTGVAAATAANPDNDTRLMESYKVIAGRSARGWQLESSNTTVTTITTDATSCA
jgi:hypothetical protein